MNRGELQQLATTRLAEAQALLAAGHPAGAYYLAGYVIECALKACIAKEVEQYDFPEKDKVLQSYSHNLTQLVRTAGLDAALDADIQQNQALAMNWNLVKDWNEATRYSLATTMSDAQNLITAVGDPLDGVFVWLMYRW